MTPRFHRSGHFSLQLALVLGSVAWGATTLPAQEQLDVGVRSTVVDRPWGKSDMKDAAVHGKTYGIALVKLIPGEQRLIKPVDETMMMQLLSEELNAHGYRLYTPGTKPEIVLTVYYGRGYLNNPFQVDGGKTETPTANSSAMGAGGENVGAPSISLTGTPTALFKELEPGHEAKLQKDNFEKLYIRVSAWQYPDEKTKRAKQLWNTTMVVDDPDHRDLNLIAAKMFQAGAPFFDHTVEEEADVYKPLPDGHVNVGTPEVVDGSKPKSK